MSQDFDATVAARSRQSAVGSSEASRENVQIPRCAGPFSALHLLASRKGKPGSSPIFRAFPRGFTLLEVMIAIAILAIALVAVYQSQSQSISMAGSSRFLTTASLLAQSRMALIDAADPREVAAGDGDFGEDFPDYRWQVEIGETEIAFLRKIILTVTHNRMVVRNTYRLTLYKVVLP